MRCALILCLFGALVTTGCGKRGSGTWADETREVGEFDAVRTEGAMTVEITVGPVQKVVVGGDDNLLSIVKTAVAGGELFVETTESYNTDAGLKVTVTVPSLDRLTIEGASSATVTGIKSDHFTAKVKGAARATLSGTTDKLTLNVSGAAKVKAGGLAAKVVDVDCSGAARIDVNASETLDVDVSGASKVQYSGAATVTQKTSGAASIKKK